MPSVSPAAWPRPAGAQRTSQWIFSARLAAVSGASSSADAPRSMSPLVARRPGLASALALRLGGDSARDPRRSAPRRRDLDARARVRIETERLEIDRVHHHRALAVVRRSGGSTASIDARCCRPSSTTSGTRDLAGHRACATHRRRHRSDRLRPQIARARAGPAATTRAVHHARSRLAVERRAGRSMPGVVLGAADLLVDLGDHRVERDAVIGRDRDCRADRHRRRHLEIPGRRPNLRQLHAAAKREAAVA